MRLKQNIPAKAIANMKIVGLLGFKFDMKVLILEVELGIFLMFLNLWGCVDYLGLLISAHITAVAIATLSDSEVWLSAGYGGMNNLCVTFCAIRSDTPRPSLPITIKPLFSSWVE